jgi:hypothetical protein
MGDYKEEHGVTRAGKFLKGLKGVAPTILELAGTVTGVSALKDLGKKIKGDTNISPEDKETVLALLQLDIQEAQEVTKRWQSDMQSDSWLSKNVRPLTLMFLILFTCFMIFIDSKTAWDFEVDPSHTMLLQTLLVTVVVAYFGSRGMEKYKKISKG